MMSITRREVIQGAALLGTAGFAVNTGRVDANDDESSVTRKPMLLQIYFQVSQDRATKFEKDFQASYVPALRKQRGYQRSSLLRLFPPGVAREIEATPTEFNYQMELVFDTEESRRKWVASEEHARAWPRATGMAEKFAWRGFDVVGSDVQPRKPA